MAAVGAAAGIPAVLALSMVVNILVFIRDPSGVRWRTGALLLVPALIVIPLTARIVHTTGPQLLAILAGGLTLLAVVALASGLRSRRLGRPVAAVVAGMLSGAMNVIGGISGPPTVIYTINAGWPNRDIRSTLQIYFFILNVAALVSLGVRPQIDWRWIVAGVAGWVIGAITLKKVTEARLRALMLLVAAVGGSVALYHGLTG